MRLGLFGGTFDPIHLGHLRSAEEIRETFGLERVVFIPAACPPHKANDHVAPAADRLAMVELATADHPGFAVSAVEIERGGRSYSVDTIRAFLRTIHPARLSFILGMDAFLDIASWKDYTLIPMLCDLIVTSRPGLRTDSTARVIPVALQSVFCYDPLQGLYKHASTHTLTFHELAGFDVSATMIRAKVRQGKSIRYLVPAPVERYLAKAGLYRREESAR